MSVGLPVFKCLYFEILLIDLKETQTHLGYIQIFHLNLTLTLNKGKRRGGSANVAERYVGKSRAEERDGKIFNVGSYFCK